MDCPYGKFGDCRVSAVMVLSYRHTDTQSADERFTLVSVKCVTVENTRLENETGKCCTKMQGWKMGESRYGEPNDVLNG